jgi:hypothetical protein
LEFFLVPKNFSDGSEKTYARRKLHGRTRNRVHFLEKIPNPEEAQKYQQKGYEWLEKKNNNDFCWHTLMQRALVSHIQLTLQEHDFTNCIWLVNKFVPSSKVKIKERDKKKKNPYRTGKWPDSLWPDVIPKEGYCGSTYLNCGSPQCEDEEPPCSAKVKICYRFETLGSLCDVLVWGAHSKAYYPSFSNLRPTNDIKRETMIAIQNGAKPSVVSKNQIKKIPSRNGGVINSSQFIPARIISAMNRNENVNQKWPSFYIVSCSNLFHEESNAKAIPKLQGIRNHRKQKHSGHEHKRLHICYL